MSELPRLKCCGEEYSGEKAHLVCPNQYQEKISALTKEVEDLKKYEFITDKSWAKLKDENIKLKILLDKGEVRQCHFETSNKKQCKRIGNFDYGRFGNTGFWKLCFQHHKMCLGKKPKKKLKADVVRK